MEVKAGWHKESEKKGKLGVWIAKAMTRKQGCENQIRNTISKRNKSNRHFDKTELESEN